MKHPLLLIALLAAAAGGVAAVVTTWSLFSASPGRASAAAPQARVDAPQDPSVDARAFAQLAQDNDDLRLRVASLEQDVRKLAARAATTKRAPVAVTDSPQEVAVQRAVREFLASRSPGDDGLQASSFTDRVGDAMAEIRAEEAAKAEGERSIERAERMERRLDGLRESLSLSSYQVSELRDIFAEQETNRAALWEARRDGRGFDGGLREEMRKERDATNASLAEVFDADQYARYQESQGGGRRGGVGANSGQGAGGGSGASRRASGGD